MDKISIDAVVKAVNGSLIKKCGENFITGVKHDSRECGAGDMFVAVSGEKQDGHKYIPQALRSGCRTVLVSHQNGWPYDVDAIDFNVIEVDDTVYAMGELAKYYLDTLSLIKIAVTGSVGKTSTRDMIYYVLKEKFSCGRNMKNFNNDIGLPLSIFQFDSSMQAAVLEMGMDKFGEIDRLAEIVKPHIAVITNIGVSHIENLGSREGIFKAKMEVTKHITSYKGNPGTLIFPWDGEFLTRENTEGEYSQVVVGSDGKSDYIISHIDDFGLKGIQFTLEHMEKNRKIRIPVPGRHNAVNGTLALAVGDLLEVSEDQENIGLSKVELTGSRLKCLENHGVTVIDDTYNASPDSMKSAMKVLEKSPCSGSKTAILGDMYELGEQSQRQHLSVGLFARGLRIDKVIAVGCMAKYIAEGASGGKPEAIYFEKKEDLYDKMNQLIGPGDIILVKGSRAMKMEQIVEKVLKI